MQSRNFKHSAKKHEKNTEYFRNWGGR
jgi:hypothetical protein